MTDRPPVRSPMRRPATAPLVHTAHEMRGMHKRVCICDVGYLAGFRQEGRHFWSMVDRSVPNRAPSSAPFSQLSPPLWQVSTP